MKVAIDVLRNFTPLPDDNQIIRLLLDDIGIEVKRRDGMSLTLELLANRGDHHCYVGLAREIHGRTGAGYSQPDVVYLETGPSPWPLRLESDLCLVYTATLLERGAAVATLGEAELSTLASAGIHSLGAVIDSTNLSNLEFGQPTHAFDADTLDGPVTIRVSTEGERALPLFAEESIALPAGVLVIADDSKILAIAGVIGCEESKTTEATTRVLLESATFDPVAVRKASRGLVIHTDSSARFERGSDPSSPLVGAGRVVHLLEGAGWKRVGATGVVGSWSDPERQITIDTQAANDFLETALSVQQAAERLTRYGFTVTVEGERISAVVPPHRLWDVEFAADLYEELAKSVGYNNTPTSLPPVKMGSVPAPAEVAREVVDQVLVGHGFYEVITDGFYSRADRDRLGIGDDHPLYRHVEITNTLDRAYSLLKNNCLIQAVATVATNLRVAHPQIKAFEWTRTFHSGKSRYNDVCYEVQMLWGVVNGTACSATWAGAGRQADPVFLKGVIGELALALSVPLNVGQVDASYPLSDKLHPGRQAGIYLGAELVGVLGEIHPEVLKAHKIKGAHPCYFEIRGDAVGAVGDQVGYIEPPTWHPIIRSLAFTLPHRVSADEVVERLWAQEPPGLSAINIVDLFAHEVDGSPARTVTFELRFDNPDADRTAEQVNGVCQDLIGAVTEGLGERGVVLR